MSKFLKSTLFEKITPMAYIACNKPNPFENTAILNCTHLNIAILDSSRVVNPPVIAALIVPNGKEEDYIFFFTDR